MPTPTVPISMAPRSKPSWSGPFDAIAPAQLETLDEVLAQRQRLETYHQQQVSHARFAATQARRRYDTSIRRTVSAAELEREGMTGSGRLRQAEEAAERFAHEPDEPTLTPEFRHQLLHLSQCLPDLWGSLSLSPATQGAAAQPHLPRDGQADGRGPGRSQDHLGQWPFL